MADEQQREPFWIQGMRIEVSIVNETEVQARIVALGALAEANQLSDQQIADRAAEIVASLRYQYRFAGGPWRPLTLNLSGYTIDVEGRTARIVPPAGGGV